MIRKISKDLFLEGEDKIIYTDIYFYENSAIDEHGKKKENFSPKYPDEKQLIKQLGDVEYLVVGGYHYSDCVKRVAEKALDLGIPTLIDLDLTDLFFHLYKQEDYFDIKQYDPEKYKQYLMNKRSKYGEEIAEKRFYEIYSSPSFGFVDPKNKKTRS